MHDNPFYAFIAVVEVDQKIDQLLNQSNQRKAEIEQLNSQLKAEQAIVAQEKEQIQTLNKQIALHELEIKNSRARQEVLTPQRDFAASAKEGKAFDVEIAALKVKQQQAEEAVFSLWTSVEAAEQRLQTLEQQLAVFTEKVGQVVAAKSVEAQTFAHETAELQQDRPRLVAGAPVEFMTKYESMRQSVSNPVVPLVGDMCGGCSTQITGTDIAQLRRHVLLPCKECYRLLYSR